MKPIIQYKNKLNIKNFLSNLKYTKKKKDNDIILSQKAKIEVCKYFQNMNDENDKKRNKRKVNSVKNNNTSSKYSKNLKHLKEIIKNISKSLLKEKIKLKSFNEKPKLYRKGKSANLLNNKISEKEVKNKVNLKKKLEKENNRKKINNIKPIQINELDLIIKNKRSPRYNINDTSNICLPPLIYSRQLFNYNKPILIGLNNLGFTCYLNAILQCLNQTEPLTNYFLSEEGVSKINNNNIYLKNTMSVQLSPAYLEVVNNLWDINKNNKSYSPIHFYEKLNEMNKVFILNKPNDSKDLLKFIFKQFHKELNIKEIKKNNKDNKTEFNFDKYDRVKTFNNFLVDFTNNNCSIISNNFYGIIEINIECIKCKDFFIEQGILIKPIIYDFKIYNMLIFPLEQIKITFKKNNSNKNIDKISIYDCFEYYQNKNNDEGKKIFCKRCNQLSEVINTSKLFNAPNILIIILNRGKPNTYNMKIEFNEIIDLTDYIKYKTNKIIYNLYGVVTHLGKSGEEGHFIAVCKNLIDNLWYKYNDSEIKKINNIKKEILDYGKPYILFYQKQH